MPRQTQATLLGYHVSVHDQPDGGALITFADGDGQDTIVVPLSRDGRQQVGRALLGLVVAQAAPSAANGQ